jgi:hypothetical protein
MTSILPEVDVFLESLRTYNAAIQGENYAPLLIAVFFTDQITVNTSSCTKGKWLKVRIIINYRKLERSFV